MVNLTRHYKDAKVNELLDVATFLDPRFKLDFVAEQDVATVRARLQEEAEVMLDDVQGSEEQGQEDPHGPHPSEEEPPPQKKRKLNLLTTGPLE